MNNIYDVIDKDKCTTTYVCMYSSPSDDWEILRVTKNPMKALDSIFSTESNYIEVWKNNKKVDWFIFSKGKYEKEYLIRDISEFISAYNRDFKPTI